MNKQTHHKISLGILILIGATAIGGCSQKPTSEEIAAQVKAAMAEEKAKEMAAVPAPEPATVSEKTAPKHDAKHNQLVRAKPQEKPIHAKAVQKIVCDNCGVVVSVNEIEQAGKGSGLGVIAGGALGGLAGNQVGQGTGRDLATIAGMVGGAIAGNKIEEKVKKTTVYDITVKLENGEERVFRYESLPGVSAGDKVRIENERLVKL